MTITTPISDYLVNMEPLIGMISNFMLMALILVTFLALIVANSMVTKTIEENTYENAMLRCLGWN